MEEFQGMYKSLSSGTKFDLSKKSVLNGKYERYHMIFKAFYYDDGDLRRYLLTNDERRQIMKYFNGKYNYFLEQKPENPQTNSSLNVDKKPELQKIELEEFEKNKDWELTKTHAMGSCIHINGLTWQILDKAISGEYCLVSTVTTGLIDDFVGVIDSMCDINGNQLLDNLEDMWKLIAVCSCQDFIRKAFPHIDRIWDNGRVTSSGRYDNFRTRYLKVKENQMVTVRLYNIASLHNGEWYLRYL